MEQEGTLFAGDQIKVADKSSAKVVLSGGERAILAAKTDLTVGHDGKSIELTVQSGNIGFSGTKKARVNIAAADYRITSTDVVSGNVAFVGSDYVGVRVSSGRATVRDARNGQSYVVNAGQERLLNLKTSGSHTPIAQLASAVPVPLPQVPPAPQATQAPGVTRGLSRAGWIAILATAGVAGTAIAILASGGNDSEDSAAVIARQRAVQQAQAVAASATAASTAATQSAGVASQIAAVTALPQATRTQAQTLQASASGIQQQISQLQNMINSLLTQLQNTTDPSQITALSGQLETARVSLNTQITNLNNVNAQLNAIITANQNVPGVPTTTLQTVPLAPPPASASIPQ